MSGAAAEPGGVWVVSGISAAGKSTVAAALADRFERSVLVEGDQLRELVRGGREEMGPDPSAEALAQLRLRYEAAAAIASRYAAAGFTCVWDDVILGPELPAALARVTARPVRLVVLVPDAAAVAAREAGRAKDGYHRFDVAGLDRILREETPRIGLWLDTTQLSVAETVGAILERADEAVVDPGGTAGSGEVSGGAAAARAVRLAAELIESVARRSPEWATANAAIAQARAVAARADRLATANEEAFAAALARPAAETLERSIELPLRIAEAAVDAGLLAEDSAGRCDGRFRADAVAAVLLAESAARVVEHLVAINLSVRPGDDVVARARRLVDAVHATAARAVDTPT